MIVSEVGRTTSGSVSFPRRHQLALGVHLQPVMRDHRAFLGKAGDMLRLLLEIAQRDEERKVGVLVAGRLEHPVELRLHQFPDAVAPRLDHHAAAHLGIFRHVGRRDHGLVPLGKIVRPARIDRADGGLGRLVLGHDQEEDLRLARNSPARPKTTGSIETTAIPSTI